MNDRWLKAALRDDNMVAELLIRLQQHQHPPPLPPLFWGQKQPRSTPSRKYPSRTSPTTPLSWTPTPSPTHSPYHHSTLTSPPSDPFSSSGSKNFSKLKEEGTELPKGRVNLKRCLKSICVKKEQRNKSCNLKRIKMVLNQQSTGAGHLLSEPEVIYAKCRSQMEVSIPNFHQSILGRHAIKEEPASTKSYGMQEVAETNKRGFFVPDLNIPVGDDGISAELW